MRKVNILSYVQQESVANAIRAVIKASNEKAPWFARAINWSDCCRQFSNKCGFTITEANLRHMLDQLKIDPSEIINIKQPKQLQKAKPEATEHRIDRLEKEINTLREQVTRLSLKSLEVNV